MHEGSFAHRVIVFELLRKCVDFLFQLHESVFNLVDELLRLRGVLCVLDRFLSFFCMCSSSVRTVVIGCLGYEFMNQVSNHSHIPHLVRWNHPAKASREA